MGPDMVVMFDPPPNDDLGFLKTIEDLSIQKVISEGAVKVFTITIFLWATGFNVGCLYSNTR
jgi:hypothetical protein